MSQKGLKQGCMRYEITGQIWNWKKDNIYLPNHLPWNFSAPPSPNWLLYQLEAHWMGTCALPEMLSQYNGIIAIGRWGRSLQDRRERNRHSRCQKCGKVDDMVMPGLSWGAINRRGSPCGSEGGPIEENSFVRSLGLTISRVDRATSLWLHTGWALWGRQFFQIAVLETLVLLSF
jgi:hypothetical protein